MEWITELEVVHVSNEFSKQYILIHMTKVCKIYDMSSKHYRFYTTDQLSIWTN